MRDRKFNTIARYFHDLYIVVFSLLIRRNSSPFSTKTVFGAFPLLKYASLWLKFLTIYKLGSYINKIDSNLQNQ